MELFSFYLAVHEISVQVCFLPHKKGACMAQMHPPQRPRAPDRRDRVICIPASEIRAGANSIEHFADSLHPQIS